MNDNHAEEILVKWMDGHPLNEEETSQLEQIQLESPEMIITPAEFSTLQQGIKQAHPEQDIPNARLFEAQLMDAISQERSISTPSSPPSSTTETSPPTEKIEQEKVIKYPWPLMIGSMAACFVFGFMLNQTVTKPDIPSITENTIYLPAPELAPVVYTSDNSLTADFYSEGQTNMIVIEGLSAIPDDLDLFELAKAKAPITAKPNRTYSGNDF